MREAPVLVADSLAWTLWNLEEARLGGRDDTACGAALDWLVARQAAGGGYGGMARPSARDRAEGRPTPTGERIATGAAVGHILAEETLRALALWGCDGWDREADARRVAAHFRAPGAPPAPDRPGWFCCGPCSVARWRALAVLRPPGWEDSLRDGLRILDERAAAGGRWRAMPFYYTLLALAELPLPEVDGARRGIRAAAERVARRQTDGTPAHRARARAVAWALA